MVPARLERNFATVVRWGLYLPLILPLYVSSSMLFPYITGRNFAFRIIIELLVIAWVGLISISSEFRPKLTPLVKSVIVFLFVVTLADLLGANPYRSFWSNYERMEGLIAIIHMALFFLMLSSVFTKYSDWRRYIYISTGISVMVAAAGIFQKIGYLTSTQGGFRVDGTIGNPAYLASYLMFHIFFLLFFLWSERQSWIRWTIIGVVLYELFTIYLTGTRGTILAMFAVAGAMAVVFALYRGGNHGERAIRRISVGVLAGVVLIAIGFLALKDTDFIKKNKNLTRFASISTSERTVQSRFHIWDIAWQGVKERPILGWGQENFYLIFNKHYNPALWSSEPWFDRSHNVIFDWLVHAGFVGLISYLAILFFGARNIVMAWRRGTVGFYQAIIIGGLLLAYFLQNLFVFDNFQSYLLIFTLLALTNFLAYPPEPAPKKEVRSSAAPAVIAVAAASVAVLGALYVANIRPIRASQSLIQALMTANQGGAPGEVLLRMQEAVNRKSFGTGEAVEQMSSLSRMIGQRHSQAKPEETRAFLEYAAGQLSKLASGSRADAKHLLFLAAVYNSAPQLAPQYPKEPLEALERAIAIAPQKQVLYFELGTTYLTAQRFQDAVIAMEQAVALDPSYPDAHLNLAITHLVAGDTKKAEGEVLAYRALVPSPDPAVLLRLVRGYIRNRDFITIRKLMEEIIQREPGNADYYAQYAATLAELGDFKGARRAVEKAVELNPRLRQEADAFIKELEGK